MTKIGDLFVEIDYDVDASGLDDAKKGLEGVKTSSLAAIGAATAFVATIANLQSIVRGGSAELKAFEAQTGLSAEALQKLQTQARLSDITVDTSAIEGSVRTLQTNLENIRLGRGDVSGFQLLGIDPRNQDAFGVIDQVRGKIDGLTNRFGRAATVDLLGQLGLDPSFIQLLESSKNGVDDLATSLVRTSKNTETLDGLTNQAERINLQASFIKDSFIEAIAPAIDLFAQAIQAVLTPITNVLKVLNSFDPIIGAIGASLVAVFAGTAFASLFGFSGALKTVIMQLGFLKVLVSGGLLAGIKAMALAFLKLSLAVFKVVAPLLIIEDLLVFLAGGESVIGDIFNAIGDTDFSELFNNLKQGFFDIFREIGRFLLEDVFDPIFEAVGLNLVDTTEEKLAKLNEKARGLQGDIASAEGGGFFGFSNPERADELRQQLATVNQQRINLGGTIAPAGLSASTDARNQAVNIVNNVEVSGDQQALGRDISNNLSNQFQRTITGLNNNGVR